MNWETPEHAVAVYYCGDLIFLFPCIAERFNLIPGQHLHWEQGKEVIRNNAAHWHLLYIASHKERSN